MSLGPIQGQQSQMIDESLLLVRYAQGIGIGLLKTLSAMRPLAERPFAGLLVPVLSEKEFVHGTVQERCV